jgi:hypothetical protein
MMDENTYWYNVAKFFSVCLCVIVCTITSCSSYKTYTLSVMVQAGADPIRATCALGVDSNEIAMCALVAAEKK